MSIRRMETPIHEILPVQYVLASVFDKSGLENLVPGLIETNQETVFVSTGGTGKRIKELLSDPQKNYVSVEDLTGTPEMEGGLVKTLTPGIHARLLGERGNPAHQEYLDKVTPKGAPKVGFFDLVVVSLYPFIWVSKEFPHKSSFEDVRGNIDIGGPTMLRATAKNFLNCAIITDPRDYAKILEEIRDKGGITFKTRANLAASAFSDSGMYEDAVAGFFSRTTKYEKELIRECYTFKEGEQK